MNTVFGLVADKLGLASTTELVQGRTRPELRTRAWATPGGEIRSVQAPSIPVDQDHDHRWVGELVHLERDKHDNVWAVAHVDEAVFPAVHVRVGNDTVTLAHDLFWSPERRSTPDWQDVVIDSISLTAFPCRVSPRPVRFMPGDLNYRREPPSGWKLERYEGELLVRACEALRGRRRGDPLVVHDTSPWAEHGDRQQHLPTGELHYRSATPTGVSGRIIELVVIPYERPTQVVHRGRRVQEVISRGAFDGITADRVRVNRDHDYKRTIGKAVRLDPHDPRGLTAELQIARTPLGDETLALADDQCLDASAGFGITAEKWERHDRRRVTKAWLDHIALTPDPAYVDARVLAVRGA